MKITAIIGTADDKIRHWEFEINTDTNWILRAVVEGSELKEGEKILGFNKDN